jgi:hypothetical protein
MQWGASFNLDALKAEWKKMAEAESSSEGAEQ